MSNRTHIVLSSADGELNSAIAERLKLTKATVGKWRLRFIDRRIAALYGIQRQVHFIPTYSSWLNQVERFFALITKNAIRRGSFTNVTHLTQRIGHFAVVSAQNHNCQPFKWAATADSILEKLHRLCSRISGTGH